MPGSVQHVEQKAVQNRPLAAGAVDHGFGWATTPQMKHTHKQNQQHRPSIDRVSAFSRPDSPGAPGSMCAEKPVDQVSPQISPCMRKKAQRPKSRQEGMRPRPLSQVEKPKGEKKNQSFTGSGAKQAVQPKFRFQHMKLQIGSGEKTGASLFVPALLEVTHRLRGASYASQCWKRRLIKCFQGRAVTQQDTHAYK